MVNVEVTIPEGSGDAEGLQKTFIAKLPWGREVTVNVPKGGKVRHRLPSGDMRCVGCAANMRCSTRGICASSCAPCIDLHPCSLVWFSDIPMKANLQIGACGLSSLPHTHARARSLSLSLSLSLSNLTDPLLSSQ